LITIYRIFLSMKQAKNIFCFQVFIGGGAQTRNPLIANGFFRFLSIFPTFNFAPAQGCALRIRAAFAAPC